MANQVISARTVDTDGDREGVPIDLSFELADGELSRITATDRDGRQYIVSLKLRGESSLCCCQGASGKMICFFTDQCNCDPV